MVDYRLGQIEKLNNVSLHLDSALNGDQILDFSKQLGVQQVVVATGAKWRRDGVGRHHHRAISVDESVSALTPDDIFSGATANGDVVIYDDDHYYLGSVLAEHLQTLGAKVTLVTPAPQIAQWTTNTLEQDYIEKRLFSLGVEMIDKHQLIEIKNGAAYLSRLNGGREIRIPCQYCIMVTSRTPDKSLYQNLSQFPEQVAQSGIIRVRRVGDCLAPSTIAAAVYEGRRFSEEYELQEDLHRLPFKRENIEVG